VEAENGNRQPEEANASHCSHLRPEDVESDAFEVGAAKDDEEITQRDGVTEGLHPLRHGADGESKTGERDGGHDDEERGDHGLLLRGSDGGDEQGHAQHADQKEHVAGEQYRDVASKRNLKLEGADGAYEHGVEEADQEEGQRLAQDEFGGTDWRDHDPFERADLSLARRVFERLLGIECPHHNLDLLSIS